MRKVPLLYKEEMVAHFSLCIWLIIFVGSAKTCIPGLFSRVCSFLHPKVFPVENPYLILKEGDVLDFISSFWYLAKLISTATSLFLQQINVVLLGASTKEHIESLFGLFSSGGLSYSLEDQ